MEYKDFTVTDFICDEYFQRWIIQPDEETDRFWNNWLMSHPDKTDVVNQAGKILSHIEFREDIPTNEQVLDALKRNLSRISEMQDKEPPGSKVISMNWLKRAGKIAAVFAGVLLVAAIFYSSWKNATTTIATGYGEIKTLLLPDGTQITLNAHSSVTYLKHWRYNQARKVHLQGEAFFKVAHLNKNEHKIEESQRFIVSTNDLMIEVLGTTFDVRNRRDQTEVILKTGKVKVGFKNGRRQNLYLIPGEMIAYEPLKDQLKRSFTDPVVQTAWVDKKLILDNASVNTIIRYVEDNYGYKVVLGDTAMGSKKMEGTLLLDNLQDVLFVLSTSLDIKIEKKDSTLLFIENK